MHRDHQWLALNSFGNITMEKFVFVMFSAHLTLFSLLDFVINYLIVFFTIHSFYRASHIFFPLRVGTPAFSNIDKLIARYFLVIETFNYYKPWAVRIVVMTIRSFPADLSVNWISFNCEGITLKCYVNSECRLASQKSFKRSSDILFTHGSTFSCPCSPWRYIALILRNREYLSNKPMLPKKSYMVLFNISQATFSFKICEH